MSTCPAKSQKDVIRALDLTNIMEEGGNDARLESFSISLRHRVQEKEGSEKVQLEIRNARPDERRRIYMALKPYLADMPKWKHGNFVLQVLIEVDSNIARDILARFDDDQLLDLAKDNKGSRTIERLIETFPSSERWEIFVQPARLLSENRYANYLIQRLIERSPGVYRSKLLSVLVHDLPVFARGTRMQKLFVESVHKVLQNATVPETDQDSTYYWLQRISSCLPEKVELQGSESTPESSETELQGSESTPEPSETFSSALLSNRFAAEGFTVRERNTFVEVVDKDMIAGTPLRRSRT